MLHVACAGGERVTLAARGGDVYVSRFRAASIDRVAFTDGRATGATPLVPPGPSDAVMGRMALVPGGLVTLTQAIQRRLLGGGSSAGYYGSVDRGEVPLVPRVRAIGPTTGARLDATLRVGGLMVDVAAMLDGDRWHVAVASPGWAFGQ